MLPAGAFAFLPFGLPFMSDSQLYLVLPAAADAAALDAAIAAGLAKSPGAALIPAALVRTHGSALQAQVERLQQAGVAVLAEGLEAWRALPGLDGVQVDGDAPQVSAARKAVGQNGSVGAICGLSRHLAMESAEAGADYIMFTPDAEPQEDGMDFAAILAWWSSMMEVPCVAGGLRTAEEVALGRSSGAEFYAPMAGVEG